MAPEYVVAPILIGSIAVGLSGTWMATTYESYQTAILDGFVSNIIAVSIMMFVVGNWTFGLLNAGDEAAVFGVMLFAGALILDGFLVFETIEVVQELIEYRSYGKATWVDIYGSVYKSYL